MAQIRIDDKTTASARYICPCSKEVIIDFRFNMGNLMNKHEMPPCPDFVNMDSDKYEKMLREKGINRTPA